MKNNGVIKSIQYLRGIAALMVVFFHFRYYLNDINPDVALGDTLFQNGAFGVDLFFIISGFIICYATRYHEERPLLACAMKRFFRIYPLMVISLLIFYLMFRGEGDAVFRSFIPLHADYSEKGPFFGYNMLSPVWTLTYEISFYALFFVGLVMSQRHRKVITLSLILFLFAALQLFLNNGIKISAYTDYDYVGNALIEPVMAILSSPMILEFCYGIALYMICVSLPDISDRTRKIFNPLAIGLILLSAALCFSPLFYGHGPLRWGVPCFLLLLGAIVYERFNGIPSFKWLFFLGNISYSLYLTHILIIKAIRKYDIHFGLDGIAAFVFAVMLSIGIAALAYRLIESRSIQVCRTLLNDLKAGRPQFGAPA